MSSGRIWFPLNPWPEGHPVAECTLSGLLHPEAGLRILLHLKSADYDSERDAPDRDYGSDAPQPFGEDHAMNDWTAPIVWNNYHAVILSATYWGWNAGSGVAWPPDAPKFSPDALVGRTLLGPPVINDRISDDEDIASAPFGIYLLGHDYSSGHVLRFGAGSSPGTLALEWTGRIALTYRGDEDFRFAFRAELDGLRFKGLHLMGFDTLEQAREALARHVAHPQDFALDEAAFQAKWVGYGG